MRKHQHRHGQDCDHRSGQPAERKQRRHVLHSRYYSLAPLGFEAAQTAIILPPVQRHCQCGECTVSGKVHPYSPERNLKPSRNFLADATEQTKKRPGLLRGVRSCIINSDYASCLCSAKHALQYTGRSSRGLNGTLATPPQFAQVASNISRSPLAPFLRASRQVLQRWGSFTKPFSA
ncbi:hypothetical protein SDC9_186557 [bioreactor metagenome]|uniref:Uncharacterized protein n=1 Tax=bioreactor metagenome TaxID=1076179 RepID=A0A645HJ33_9ZZZZ